MGTLELPGQFNVNEKKNEGLEGRMILRMAVAALMWYDMTRHDVIIQQRVLYNGMSYATILGNGMTC